MPRVYNKRYGDAPAKAVYVGRGNGSKFGNPFTHEPTVKLKHPELTLCKSREEAVRVFSDWLTFQPDLMSSMRSELMGKDLVCWCAPKGGLGAEERGGYYCHGQVILRAISGG